MLVFQDLERYRLRRIGIPGFIILKTQLFIELIKVYNKSFDDVAKL